MGRLYALNGRTKDYKSKDDALLKCLHFFNILTVAKHMV